MPHLFRLLVVGLVSCRRALWLGLFVSAPEQIVCSTDFAIAGLWATGCDGRLSQMLFQDCFVRPVGVLHEEDVMGAVGPPPTSVCRTAMGPASLHLWFV